MKNLGKILCFALALMMGMSSCEKEEDITTLNSAAKLVATLSTNTLVLNKDNATQDAITISWAKPDFGFNAAAEYSIFMDKKGNNFDKARIIERR
ncbi:MAG: hypothetical protein HC817_06905 [Saprospiraceae bacterium]|nr:hypothetical protein [Saprospiraceae bacterium]